MTIPKNRVRAKRPKTKSGCRTCRIRRIKCDEIKPDCWKCSSTGRACEWFEYSEQQDSTSTGTSAIARTCKTGISSCTPSLPRPWYVPLGQLNRLEGLAFTFFRHHTASQLQGTLQSRLWNSWAMQLSHQNPAVLHAVIAVGSIHHARSGLNDALVFSMDYRTQLQFALSQYAKAMAELRRSIETASSADIDVVLLVCLLFVGFELLQGHVALAMEHLQNGLGIISQHCRPTLDSYAQHKGTMALNVAPDHLVDELVPAFARIDYASTMFGQRHPVLNLIRNDYAVQPSLGIPQYFDSIMQAQSHLELLASGIFRLRGDLLRRADEVATCSGDAPSGAVKHQCYIKALSRTVDLGSHAQSILARTEALRQGMIAFGKALMSSFGGLGETTDRATMAIQIQYVQVFFFAMNCREESEMACDSFSDLFESAIDLATKYIFSAPRFSDTKPKRAFALEAGVLPTVFLIAEKCRDPRLRRKAVALMREGCVQEAMWDGKPYATFMQRLAELEESRALLCTGLDGLKMHKKPPIASDIPEWARYAEVVLVGEVHTLYDARLICARYRHESDGSIEVIEQPVDISGDPDYLHDLCYGWR